MKKLKKKKVVGGHRNSKGQVKVVECFIMDLADDIACSTYDLEDCLKAGFLSPSDILSSRDRLLDEVAKKVSKELELDAKNELIRSEVLRHFTEIFSSLSQKGDRLEQTQEFIETYRAYRDLGSSGYL